MTDNFQLYRALPRLSGNMQIDLVVDLVPGGSMSIREVHMRPIHNSLYVPPRDEQLMLRPHKDNIARFYAETLSSFYDSEPPANLASDWFLPVVRPAIQPYDDSLWRGCKHMSYKLYGTQCEFFVPLWIESASDLVLEMEIGEDKDKYHLDLTSPSSEFGRYFREYLTYTKIVNGNSKVLNIDLTSGNTTIRGIDVTSGNFVTTIDKTLTKNIMIRERPLLEFNALITNLFSEYRMICPQAINLNICFNPPTPEDKKVDVDVRVLSSGKALDLRDLFVEHHANVWHPGAQERYAEMSDKDKATYDEGRDKAKKDGELKDTIIFDYLQDKYAVPLMHINKVTPSICHWKYADQAKSVLFNVYPYNLNSSENSVSGLASIVKWKKGTTENALFGRTKDWRDITEIMGTTKYTYKSSGDGTPQSIRILLAEPDKGMDSVYIPDPKNSIGIILANYNSGSLDRLPGTQANATTEPYWSYDLHRYSDIDNRYDLHVDTQTYLGTIKDEEGETHEINTDPSFYSRTNGRELEYDSLNGRKKPARDGWTWIGGPGECDADNRKGKPNIGLFPEVLYLIFNKSPEGDLKVIIYHVPPQVHRYREYLNEELRRLEAKLSKARREKENAEKLINSEQNYISRLENSIEQSKQNLKITKNDDERKRIEDQIQEDEKSIKKAEKSIASLKTKISNLERTIQHLNDKIPNFKDSINGKISDFEGKINKIRFPETMVILEAIRKYMAKYIPILKVADNTSYSTTYWADMAFGEYERSADPTGQSVRDTLKSLDDAKDTLKKYQEEHDNLTSLKRIINDDLEQYKDCLNQQGILYDTYRNSDRERLEKIKELEGEIVKKEEKIGDKQFEVTAAHLAWATDPGNIALLQEYIRLANELANLRRELGILQKCKRALEEIGPLEEQLKNVTARITELENLIQDEEKLVNELQKKIDDYNKNCPFYGLPRSKREEYFREHTRFSVHNIDVPAGLNLADFEALHSMASTPDQKKPISYIKSIIAVRDESIPDASEVIYRKVNIPLTTRLIYDGWIRPCFCPAKTNVLYYKVPAPKSGDPGAKYLASGVPPMYPSIGYDSVVPDLGETHPRPWSVQKCARLRLVEDGGRIRRKANDKTSLTDDRNPLYDWHYDFIGISGDPSNIEYMYEVTGTLK